MYVYEFLFWSKYKNYNFVSATYDSDILLLFFVCLKWFRQTLPVIQYSTYADEIHATVA